MWYIQPPVLETDPFPAPFIVNLKVELFEHKNTGVSPIWQETKLSIKDIYFISIQDMLENRNIPNTVFGCRYSALEFGIGISSLQFGCLDGPEIHPWNW